MSLPNNSRKISSGGPWITMSTSRGRPGRPWTRRDISKERNVPPKNTARQWLRSIALTTWAMSCQSGSSRRQKSSTSRPSSAFNNSTSSVSAIRQLRVKTFGERVGHAADVVRHKLETMVGDRQVGTLLGELREHLAVAVRQQRLQLARELLGLDGFVRFQHAGSFPE